ncbi:MULTISPECIES: diguanylate cyclase [unclassified Rhizobium]|uniref:diguanylate cyclase n=1 Tax=unclassified Rhizobium TaxID=2613769 RepID=UPI00161755D4|nr:MULTISPECIES: diguanylate cyclase [unclassified Rhizobium]MBB3542264.1 diguanylate cyclase (GGDEF)-like protein [Rhizobium sp. BK399]MCS3738123.1 diguanylate cyclase (GGDEF)-like protein [Rhizobium sp. BK661]
MRISTITNWAYAVTVVLTVLSGGAFILSAYSAVRERSAVEMRQQLDELADQLAIAAEQTTEDARLYVMRGEDRHLQAFRSADGEERAREEAIKGLKLTDLSSPELAALRRLESDAEALDQIEERAVADYGNGDRDGARQTLFGPEHERLQTDLLASVQHFTDLVATRADDELAAAKARTDLWDNIAKSMLGLTAAVFIGVLYFVLKRRVATPLLRMTGIVNRLAKQDYDVEVLPDRRHDEIGEMNEAIQIFRDNGLERERLDAERRRDQKTKDHILQMMHRLQACQQQEELADVVSLFAPQIFPHLAGHLYLMNGGRSALTSASRWLQPNRSHDVLAPAECWGLRRGRPHVSDHSRDDVPCQHLEEGEHACICIPLSAHGDTVGLLYFEGTDGGKAMETARLYIEIIAENIGLAIANLQLRERLTQLAVRDPLTGLLNRRSLDDEMNRLRRDTVDRPTACLMVDIDHFKHFNDEFGHDAGDHVMRQVATLMAETAGKSGSVYRFGGEEFTVLLPEGTRESAFDIGEKLRNAVEAAPITYQGRPLGTVTVSIGIALADDDKPAATLLQRADAALLRAKSKGRNITLIDGADGSPNHRLAG